MPDQERHRGERADCEDRALRQRKRTRRVVGAGEERRDAVTAQMLYCRLHVGWTRDSLAGCGYHALARGPHGEADQTREALIRRHRAAPIAESLRHLHAKPPPKFAWIKVQRRPVSAAQTS